MSLLIWAGASISANMIAAPAKFQVADLTRAVALQVGRVQFLWVGYLEMFLAALAALAFATETPRVQALVLAALSVFTIQHFVVLPRLSILTDQVIAGTALGGSKLHLIFIALECTKLFALLLAAAMALLSPTLQTGRI
ncbi:hypothetical protein [uncultured Tateyamaria sp.]|uniref:hypothetical protein n=1 Tax=uncultured Tateyamaria sp. TaxID=455651 RepID=UPI0026239922|nr:hypothetical protein [uncultured Tateyamaria sp.]